MVKIIVNGNQVYAGEEVDCIIIAYYISGIPEAEAHTITALELYIVKKAKEINNIQTIQVIDKYKIIYQLFRNPDFKDES
jgi:hypothetical protein